MVKTNKKTKDTACCKSITVKNRKKTSTVSTQDSPRLLLIRQMVHTVLRFAKDALDTHTNRENRLQYFINSLFTAFKNNVPLLCHRSFENKTITSTLHHEPRRYLYVLCADEFLFIVHCLRQRFQSLNQRQFACVRLSFMSLFYVFHENIQQSRSLIQVHDCKPVSARTSISELFVEAVDELDM